MLVKNQLNNASWIGDKSMIPMLPCSRLFLFMILILVLSGCGAPPGDDPAVIPPSSNTLLVPSVIVVAEDGSINLNWNDSNADQYRVLYWKGNDAPQELMTTSTAYTLPSSLSVGTYTIIIEAYDALGNSLFSAPITVEVV